MTKGNPDVRDQNEPAAAFSHHDVAAMQDPYPLFADIRGRCPVAHSDEHGGFYFGVSYDSVKRILSDYRSFSSAEGAALPQGPVMMLPVDIDPPEQTRFRKMLNPYFTVEEAEQARPRITALVHDLIDSFIEDGAADAASQLTRPTLSSTILPVLGVPEADRYHLTEVLEYMAHYKTQDPEGYNARSAEVGGYLMRLAAGRRAEPGQNDLVQALVTEKVGDRALTDEEVFRVLLVALFGGLDTTHAALSEAILHLSRHPEDKQRLSSGEVDMRGAIDEFVRFASPIQALRRTVCQATELEGQTIPAGSRVVALNGAANRDPNKFPEPDRCLIDRDASAHLSFGNGAHICLGRNFARVMMDVVLRAMLERLPDFTVAADFVPEYAVGEARGMKNLPIRFTPGKRRTA